MKNFLLLTLTAVLSACASPEKIPPVQNPGGAHGFVWHDLISNEPARSEYFYAELFDWTFKETGRRFKVIEDPQGRRIGGLVANQTSGGGTRNAVWLSVIAVEDLASALETVRTNGGSVLKEAEKVPDRGTIAVVADPWGAFLQLVEPATRLRGEITLGEITLPWIWHELISQDPAAAAEWYTGVCGLSTEKSADGKRFILKDGERLLASIRENPFEDTRSQWIPVLAVSGFDEIAGRVESLGGKLQPLPAARGKTALILDPGNAPLVIQEKGEAP